MESVSIISADADHCVARNGSLITFVIRGPFTDAAARGCFTAVEDAAKIHAKALSVLAVIEPSAPGPSPEARNRSAETVKRVGELVSGWAVVVEGTGLRPTMIRSILVGISLMSRTSIPMKYFEDTETAAVWLAAQPGSKVANRTVLDVVKTARAGMPVHAA